MAELSACPFLLPAWTNLVFNSAKGHKVSNRLYKNVIYTIIWSSACDLYIKGPRLHDNIIIIMTVDLKKEVIIL